MAEVGIGFNARIQKKSLYGIAFSQRVGAGIRHSAADVNISAQLWRLCLR
jgi:hypothetical protein